MLTVSDRIQIPSKTTHKDTGTKVNESYYFISSFTLNISNFFLLANTAFGLPVQRPRILMTGKVLIGGSCVNFFLVRLS